MSEKATYQDLAGISLIRFAADIATRGLASSRNTSARVAALTCARVLVLDSFDFSMVHIVTNDLLKSVLSVTPVPSFTHNHVLMRA
jgi:hypothetical protein